MQNFTVVILPTFNFLLTLNLVCEIWNYTKDISGEYCGSSKIIMITNKKIDKYLCQNKILGLSVQCYGNVSMFFFCFFVQCPIYNVAHLSAILESHCRWLYKKDYQNLCKHAIYRDPGQQPINVQDWLLFVWSKFSVLEINKFNLKMLRL